MLDESADVDHGRSVLTFAGPARPMVEAAFRGIREAVRRIDLRVHSGVHPRVGAADVVPFIPLGESPMERCVEMARELALRVSSDLDLPVYLYGYAALRPDRVELPAIRNIGFERLHESIRVDPSRAPDFGPRRLHPSAGATIIGARELLVAFNLVLSTSDVEVARRIAGRIREKDGGILGVRALGFKLQSRELSQVSVNLVDYKKTSLHKLYRRVCDEALKLKTKVIESEIVGLIPEEALRDGTPEDLGLTAFNPSQILEKRIEEVFSTPGTELEENHQ